MMRRQKYTSPIRRPAPTSLAELRVRAEGLEGFSVEELASALGVKVPDDPVRSKGFVGQLVEAKRLESCTAFWTHNGSTWRLVNNQFNTHPPQQLNERGHILQVRQVSNGHGRLRQQSCRLNRQ